jgi:hypothetical protein
LAYVLAALLALAVAVGVGAMAALMLQGWLRSNASDKAPPTAARGHAEQAEKQSKPQQGEKHGGARGSETDYVSEVGKIQSEAVKAFMDSHDKLLRYDALTSDDVEQMRANQAALRGLTEKIGGLDPPPRYEKQYELFGSAIEELHETAKLAYALAADPTSATQSDFGKYDSRAKEAADRLRRSNEILSRDFATMQGVREVGPP